MEIMQILAQGMNTDMARLTSASVNMANIRTPGYKREAIDSSAFDRQVAALSTEGSDLRSSRATPATSTDMRAGAFQHTGRALDFAVSASSAFFELISEGGPIYTRQGAFHVDPQGRLVSSQGLPVMGRSGEIRLQSTTPVVDKAGNVYDDGRFVDRLRLATFAEPGKLTRLSGGMFSSGSNKTELTDGETVAVLQGFLESSNVDHAREMVNVVEIMRHFESMQKVTQMVDDMNGRAIQKLGEF